MEYIKFYKYISETIEVYKKMLFEDFNQHPNFERLASALCTNKTGVREWINALEIENFERSKVVGELKMETIKFSDIDKIAYDCEYINVDQFNLYSFFAKYEYSSLEELRKDDNRYFYLCQEDFVTKLDNLFTNNINGYLATGTNTFTKLLKPGFKLKIDSQKKRKHFETIVNYSYPNIYLEFKKTKYTFVSELDTFSFLLTGGATYLHFFYKHQLLCNRKGEPVIYEDDETGKFILTNSYENLGRFNKFIFFNAELFIHYFSVFEKWVTDILIPKIEENEGIE